MGQNAGNSEKLNISSYPSRKEGPSCRESCCLLEATTFAFPWSCFRRWARVAVGQQDPLLGRRTGHRVEENEGKLKSAVHLSVTVSVLVRTMAGASLLPLWFCSGSSLISPVWSHSGIGLLGNLVPAYRVDNSQVSSRIGHARWLTPDCDRGSGWLRFCFRLFVFIYCLLSSKVED